MTLLTYMILATVALTCGLRIGELYWQEYHLFHFHLSWALYLLAFGVFLGGIYYGFGPHFPTFLKDLIWKTTLLAIGLTAIFFLLAAVSAVVSYDIYVILRWIPVVAFAIYATAILRHSDYTHAVKFYAPVMIFMLMMIVYIYVGTKDAGAGKIILGIFISFLGVAVWGSKLSIHGWFNHNDLFFVIQTVGLWFIFRGSLAIKNIFN